MMQNDPCDFSPTLLLCQIEAALTRNAHSLKSIIWNLSDRYEGPDGPSLVKIEGHKANVTPKELSILFNDCESIINELSQVRTIFSESNRLEAASRILNNSTELGKKRRFAFSDAFCLMQSTAREKNVVEIPLQMIELNFEDNERSVILSESTDASRARKVASTEERVSKGSFENEIKNVSRKSSDRNIFVADSDRKIPLSNSDRSRDWVCPICTLCNASRLRSCDACYARRPTFPNSPRLKVTEQLTPLISAAVPKNIPKTLSKKISQKIAKKATNADGNKTESQKNDMAPLHQLRDDSSNAEEGSLNIIEVSADVNACRSTVAGLNANSSDERPPSSKNYLSLESTDKEESDSWNTVVYPNNEFCKEMKSVSIDIDICFDKGKVKNSDTDSNISDIASRSDSGSSSSSPQNGNINKDRNIGNNLEYKNTIVSSLPFNTGSTKTPTIKSSAQNFWICGTCTVENPMRDKICDLCGQPKIPKICKSVESLPVSFRKFPRIGLEYQIDLDNIPTAEIFCKIDNCNDDNDLWEVLWLYDRCDATTNDINVIDNKEVNTAEGKDNNTIHPICIPDCKIIEENFLIDCQEIITSANSMKNVTAINIMKEEEHFEINVGTPRRMENDWVDTKLDLHESRNEIEHEREKEIEIEFEKNNHDIILSSSSPRSSSIMGLLLLKSMPVQHFGKNSNLEEMKNQFKSSTFQDNFSVKINKDCREKKNFSENECENQNNFKNESIYKDGNLNARNLLESSLFQVRADHLSNVLDITSLNSTKSSSDQNAEVEVEVEVEDKVMTGQDKMIGKHINNKNYIKMGIEMEVFDNETDITKNETKEQLLNLHNYLNIFPDNEVESLKVLLNCKNDYLTASSFLKKLSIDGKLSVSESFLVLDTKKRLKFQNSILRHGTNWTALKV